jgi:hypothetical protein
MELALNLAWLGIAIVIISLFVFSRSFADRKVSSIAPWRMWVAVGCGLILLFFVISCTDDLNEQILTIEDSTFSWRHGVACRKPSAVDSSACPGHSLATIPAAALPYGEGRLDKAAPSQPQRILSFPPLRRSISRGPPPFSPNIS